MPRRDTGQKTAVALKYNPEESIAPIVVASGHGHLAEKIINIAESNGVPVYRDDSAASLLVMLNVGESIPPELYQVIAGVYAEVVAAANQLVKKNQNI